jgi:integrase
MASGSAGKNKAAFIMSSRLRALSVGTSLRPTHFSMSCASMALSAVQELLGHSTITMTLDIYGHMFPSMGDCDELNAAVRQLLA